MIDKGVSNKGFIWNPNNCECECDKSCDIVEYLDYSNYKCRKKIVDKLVVEQYTENIEEGYFSPENEHKYSSCTLYIILLSIFLTISIGIGIYFVYSRWYLKKIFHVLSLILTLRQQFIECNSIELINGRSQRNKYQKSKLLLS